MTSKINPKIILITLLSITFLTKQDYSHYVVLAGILPFILMAGKFNYIFNRNLVYILLFSLLYGYLAIVNIGINQYGIGSFLKILISPSLFYVSGRFIAEKSTSQSQLTSNIIFLMIVFIFIVLTSSFVDILERGLIIEDRTLKLIFSDNLEHNATLINAILSIFIAQVPFVLYRPTTKKEKKWKYILIIFSFTCFFISLRQGNRTSLFIVAISLLIMSWYMAKVQYSTKRYLSSILGLIMLILIMYIYNNYITALVVMETRISSDEFGLFTLGGRTILMEYYGSQILDYPLGGIPPHQYLSSYAHNYFIDISRVAGILPLFFIILFTVSSLRRTMKIVLSVRYSDEFLRLLLLFLFTGIYTQFLVEPIVEGAPILFFFYLLLCGIIDSLYKGYPLKKG